MPVSLLALPLPMIAYCRRSLFFLFALFSIASVAAEVSKTPPPTYNEFIRPLLTPLEEVISRKDPHQGADEPGTVRLAEKITRVEEDGTFLRAEHFIYQPYTEKGAENISSDRFRFHARHESVHLALARTILEDGTEKTLGPNAVFLQKGKNSSASIYDDAQDLVIIFPDVKPGVLCEVVVVYEHTAPRVKNGYGDVIDWEMGWPVSDHRRLLDMPAAWKSRLKIDSLGPVLPRTRDLPSPDGRVRIEWTRNTIKSRPYEPNPAPSSQTGPSTWMSTFSSWDDMAIWYGSLLAARSDLDASLASMVDEWTKNAATPRETLEIIHDHVANDIRYEGLEFGLSGLQPYACSTVWKNQYGDCKDKANLLVAMLRHKGIKARLVLVNTEHAGLVNQRLPDYRHFNHAIAVVDLPGPKEETQHVFCDATIEHGWPGLLTPSSANRDVLAIDDGKAVWLRTPDTRAGEDAYHFDLDLTEDGRLAGWLTVKSAGYYAVSLVSRFAGLDRETARARLNHHFSNFVAGAEVVDFVLPKSGRQVNTAEMKVYLSGPARQVDHDGRLSVPFPKSSALFNDYGDGKNRKTSYFQWPDTVRVEAIIRLPEHWQPESLPPPLKLDTPAYLAESSWRHEGNQCLGSLLLECRQQVIPAEGVAVLAQANRAMSSWLEVPIFVKQGAATHTNHPDFADDPPLPLMPTGKGQLELVDRWYPRAADSAKRRAALEKTIRFFPNDPETIFDARAELAYLRYLADDNDAACSAFSQLVKRRPNGVSAESFAYARYLFAMSLQETDAADDSLPILREIADDEQISDYRRAWSATLAGKQLAKQQPVPEEAVMLFKKAIATDQDCHAFAIEELIPAMVATGRGDELVQLLAESQEFSSLEERGATVLKNVAENAKTSKNVTAEALLPWLVKARDQSADPERKKRIELACSSLESWVSKGEAYAAVRANLLKALENLPEPIQAKEAGDDAPAVEAELEKLYNKDRTAWLALAAGYFRKFEPTPHFSENLWRYLGYLSNMEELRTNEAGQAFFVAIMEAADKLPKDDDNYWECQFTNATWLTQGKRYAEAETVYREIVNDPALPSDFAHSGWHRLADILERVGHWEEATDGYLKFKDQYREHREVAENLLRAGLLQARVGKREDALATWKLLADVPKSILEDTHLSSEINTAIALAENPKATLQQWSRMDRWWKSQFLPYVKALGAGEAGEPRFFLMDQADDLNLRCRKHLTEKNLSAMVNDLVSVAASAHWLPGHLVTLQQFTSIYIRPLHPAAAKLEPKLFEIAHGAIKIGTIENLEYSLRMHAAMLIDHDNPAKGQQLMDGQFKEAPNRSAEHRERCGYLFAAAATHTGKKLKEALEVSTQFHEQGPAFIAAGTWAGIHADLLVKNGRQDEALAFLKTKAEDPKIRSSASDLAPISEKLENLKQRYGSSEALTTAAKRLLQQHAPPWYDHVGPADLKDPRIVDSEEVLNGDLSEFHKAEQFRLRMLIATSSEVSSSSRQTALIDAFLAAGSWQTTWQQAVDVWSVALDDDALPEELRLQVLWQAATKLAQAGQAESLAKLREKPIFGRFNDAYADRYFPMLETGAKLVVNPEGAAKALEILGNRELDSMELTLSNQFYTAILASGDLRAAAAARRALKKWKLAPDAVTERSRQRMDWIRLARKTREHLPVTEAIRATFNDEIEAHAAKAPEGWRNRIDLENMNDLSHEDASAIAAAVALSGFRYDPSNLQFWFENTGMWLESNGGFEKQKADALIAPILAQKLDPLASYTLGELIMDRHRSIDDWKKLDELLNQSDTVAKLPIFQATVDFWRYFRGYRQGDTVDVKRVIEICERMDIYAEIAKSTLLESLIVNGDLARLTQLVDEMDPSEFSTVYSTEIYLEALHVLDREEEAELVMEDAERTIKEQVMTAWLDHSSRAVKYACDLAVRCERLDLLPVEWKKQMPTITADKVNTAINRARIAALDKDWKSVVAALDPVRDEADESAEWNWLMARALVETGKKDHASPHLEAILQMGILDASHYHEAWTLLQKLKEP